MILINTISWARTENGDFLVRHGSRVLEALMLTRRDNGKVGFPGGFLNTGESVLHGARRKLCEEALGYDSVS